MEYIFAFVCGAGVALLGVVLGRAHPKQKKAGTQKGVVLSEESREARRVKKEIENMMRYDGTAQEEIHI